jgi:hypothetical protein
MLQSCAGDILALLRVVRPIRTKVYNYSV